MEVIQTLFRVLGATKLLDRENSGVMYVMGSSNLNAMRLSLRVTSEILSSQ